MNLSRDEAAARSRAVTVLSYEVQIDLSEAADPQSVTFPVSSTITVDARHSESFADFVGAAVDSVEINGDAVPVEFDGARVQLRGLVPGSVNTVRIAGHARYSRTGEGMHRFVDPADGMTYLYTQSEPSDSRRVFPQFDQPNLKGTLAMTVTGPAAWRLLSNGAEVSRSPAGVDSRGNELTTVGFATVGPLSTYVMCVCAGPYERYTDVWRGTVGETEFEIPLGMFVRRALAESFDPDRLFEVTKAGLDHFHEAFGLPYAFGKYDSVFVPEYNLGAMENPGLVTFSDAGYVFDSGATHSQYEARANTVLHEMAHMWFGNLVTPRWWDDLWLKESFADYMAVDANVRAGGFPGAWTPFAARRKMWAYQQDQLPSTHPVVADVADVRAAEQNFDGITYAKGAALLKQLVHWVGQDTFLTGARSYFRRYAHSSTTLNDLLSELSAAGGRDLTQWSRTWLETSGVGTLTPVLVHDENYVRSLVIEQESEPLRPHRCAVGLYHLEPFPDGPEPSSDGYASQPRYRLRRTHLLESEISGARTEVFEAAGLPVPDLVLVNDDDLTYAKTRLDARSLATVRAHLSDIESSLTRAVVWSSLWNATRDAEMPAAALIEITRAHASQESDSSLLSAALAHQREAADRYLPTGLISSADVALFDHAWEQLRSAAPGSDEQLTWAREVARAASYTDARARETEQLLSGPGVPGLVVTPDLRWRLLEALAAIGNVERGRLNAELENDSTSLAPVRHLRAVSSFPDRATKDEVWEALIHDTNASNDEVTARLAGAMRVRHQDLLRPYAQPFFDHILFWWVNRSQEIAQRILRGGFPFPGSARPGVAPERHHSSSLSRAWLDANPDAPAPVVRIVTEGLDQQLRSLRAQAAF